MATAASEEDDVANTGPDLKSVINAYLDPLSARLTVAILNEALINKKVRVIVERANRKLADHLIAFVLKHHGYHAMPPDMEARMMVTRSWLNGLRVSVLFNPTADWDAIRRIVEERLLKIFNEEWLSDVKAGYADDLQEKK